MAEKTVKSLEQRITDKEIEWLRSEVFRATKIIADAFGKYLPVRVDEKEGKEIAEDIRKQIWQMSYLRVPYYAGHTLAPTAESFVPAPGKFLEAIKSYAVDQFLTRIDEIESIADEAHGMARNG